jgi:uncharacterized protein (DUF488 family)
MVLLYRRKILLALIEIFDGMLSKTDCQKLLFLFCMRRGKSYYDFFPHKYGNFSLILSEDKNRLADLGLLTSHSDFQLKGGGQSHLNQVETTDLRVLHSLVSEVGSLRGEALIHKIYLEFPHYVSRSQIAPSLLSAIEYEQIRSTWNNVKTPCLFTVGYEGLSIDAYLDILVSNNISVLVDVRKNPISRKYGFSKAKLTDCTKIAGISYIHIPELGVPSDLRQKLNSEAAYRELFDYYCSQILPAQKDSIERLKTIVNDNGRVAITCFEADHQFCHRHKIAEYLEHDPDFHTPIAHLHKNCTFSASLDDVGLPPGLWDKNTVYSS